MRLRAVPRETTRRAPSRNTGFLRAQSGRQSDVLGNMDRVKVNDVRLPSQNVFSQSLFEISSKQPFAEGALTGLDTLSAGSR